MNILSLQKSVTVQLGNQFDYSEITAEGAIVFAGVASSPALTLPDDVFCSESMMNGSRYITLVMTRNDKGGRMATKKVETKKVVATKVAAKKPVSGTAGVAAKPPKGVLTPTKVGEKKPVAKAAPVAEKKPVAKAASVVEKKAAGRKETPAQYALELVSENKHTDDAIFVKIETKFPGETLNPRLCVNARGILRKQGMSIKPIAEKE